MSKYKYGNVWEIFLVEILSIQIKKMGGLVDYFPGNNLYGYCVKN